MTNYPVILEKGITKKWNTDHLPSKIKWAIVFTDSNGFKEIMSGQHIYDTYEECNTALIDILTNNSPDRLTNIYGINFFDTVELLQVECTPIITQILDYPFWDIFEKWIDKQIVLEFESTGMVV